jgi:hypothetical protein
MEETLKTSLFNPKDKLNESSNFNEKFYLDFVPNEFKSVVRKKNVNMILKNLNGIQLIKIIQL